MGLTDGQFHHPVALNCVMISKTEAAKGVVNFLSETFEKNGFVWQPKEQLFLKKTLQGLLVFDLHFYDRTDMKTGAKGFLVEPYIWIIVNQTEEVYKKITVNTFLKKKTDFITLGNSVADLETNPDGIYKARNKSLDLFVFGSKNINYVSFEILTHFKKTALPYFEANCSSEAVDFLLNRHPREYCVHMRNDVFRIIKGLIAAWLTRNPKFEYLIQVYSEIIIDRDMPVNCKEELKNLKDYMKNV